MWKYRKLQNCGFDSCIVAQLHPYVKLVASNCPRHVYKVGSPTTCEGTFSNTIRHSTKVYFGLRLFSSNFCSMTFFEFQRRPKQAKHRQSFVHSI
jgi:hypothetical protein